MPPPPLALVTGANRGLGLEVARGLAAARHRVLLAGRHPGELAAEAGRLRAAGLDAGTLDLDLADPVSIAGAAARVAAEASPLDALVQNAAVYLEGADPALARRTFAVNVLGPLRLAAALAPRLRAGSRVVMVSSGMGVLGGLEAGLAAEVGRLASAGAVASLAERLAAAAERGEGPASGTLCYSISKALLNALTRVLAEELRPRGVLVNAVCPGWVRTRMGGASAPRSVEDGARGILWAATLPADGPSGGFFRDGSRIPW